MPNTLKVLVALTTLILVSTIGIFSYNAINSKQTQNTPSQTSLVNSVSQNSQSNLSKSTLQSSLSSVNNSSQVVASAKCNLPESENLVKTEEGCFELNIVDKNALDKYKAKVLNEISLDYWKKVNQFFKSPKDSQKLRVKLFDNPNTPDKLKIDISVASLEISKLNPTFTDSQDLYILGAEYQIIKGNNQYYNFNFEYYVLRGDGETKNIQESINQYKEYLKFN